MGLAAFAGTKASAISQGGREEKAGVFKQGSAGGATGAAVDARGGDGEDKAAVLGGVSGKDGLPLGGGFKFQGFSFQFG